MTDRSSGKLLFLCATVVLLTASPAYAQTRRPPTPVIVQEVRTGQISDRIEALGTLRANEAVEITATVTDTIVDIHFDDGQRVNEGDILVQMTNDEELAQFEEARFTLKEAESQFERVKPLAGQGAVAASVLEERQRVYQTAQARLAAIEARLRNRLILAPFSGVVGLRNISVGALVTPGTVITTLDDDETMKLDFSIPETFLAGARPGVAITTRSRAFEDRRFEGTIVSVDSRVDPVTRSIKARALIPNPDKLLKPGMLMTVELIKDPRDALIIDEQALVPLGENNFVFVVNEYNGGYLTERRQVRIGARRPGEVEIVSGLEEGERVITHGSIKVQPGDAVSLRAVQKGGESLSELLGQ